MYPRNKNANRHLVVFIVYCLSVSEPSFTRTGQIKGKMQYMSPEQAMGQKVDRRTDIYAFGIVIYEILTGHQLFEFKNEVDTNNLSP